MYLYLIRHGIAQEHQLDIKDEERSLTTEGRKKTEKIAQRLIQLKFKFDLILTSPLVRAKQTAEILMQAGLSSQLETSLHLSWEGNVHNWIQEWLERRRHDQKYDQQINLALVGHEPCLSSWAEILVWGEAKEKLILKKAGIIGIEVPNNGSIVGRGQVFWLTPPKYLL
ncbi:Phosphohistidine Phosphatase, SixA [Raphidiopsis brookii D9]|nr:Phosphohistidine Phosphatase, SixA [Raphidiopsis brookii D9]